MRAIESKKDIEKRQRKNQIIIGVILIVVMLGSTFGYAFFGDRENTTNKVEYNGYEFFDVNGYWGTTIGNSNFIFLHNPLETESENINAEINLLNSYSGKVLYFYSEDEPSSQEIYRNLGSFVERIQGACVEEKDCPENWPVRDCTNNFILIKESNISRIYQQENCVFIEGASENLTRVTDEFLYLVTGIKN